ncbi:MAG: DUF362 domain-containing protein [Acidobacteriia bacterium]|nr:DUF362 domain-containing protein [Terriglobia bacterium]
MALGACSRQNGSAEESLVSAVRAPAYDQSIFERVRRVLEQFRLDVRGKKVVLKPNLVEFDPNAVVNTNPLLVHAALEGFRSLGADVRIAEGPGHRRVTLDLAEAAGYFQTIPKFENLFIDLNLDSVARLDLSRPVSKLRSLYLPKTVLGADLLVSMPKLKTHHWVGATLSMKNLFGVVPGGVYGWPKNVLHWAGIEESIVDLHRLFPRHFCLVDGISGMEGNGPIQGTTKHVGAIIAGNDMVAVDATCCRIMGINPEKVRYLQMAESKGQLSGRNVRQIGEAPQHLATPFDLLPQFQPLRSL